MATDCIFCQIVAGTIPAHKVYEDNDFLAFLDINPRAPGHTQIIPKKHYRWVWDIPNVGECFEVTRKIAQAQQKVFGTAVVWSRIMGDEVEHAHIWLFPNPKEATGDQSDLAGNAKLLRTVL